MKKRFIAIIIFIIFLAIIFFVFKQETTPVCGADGETYTSRGEAENNGIEVAYMGTCNERPEGMVDNRCTVLPQKGSCDNLSTKYYFDLDEKVCKSYVWGGCGLVGFDSMKECVDSCGSFGK
jgi:hypothetical protein